MQNLEVDPKGTPLFKAFDELKTLEEWGKDSRCKVRKSVLEKRLFGGWALEEALSVKSGEPGNHGQALIVEAFGESKTLEEWGKDARCRVPILVMSQRLAAGMSSEAAISKPSCLFAADSVLTKMAATGPKATTKRAA